MPGEEPLAPREVALRVASRQGIAVEESSAAPARRPVTQIVTKDRGQRGDGDDRNDGQRALGGENGACDERGFTWEWKSERLEQEEGEQEEQRLSGMLVDVARDRREEQYRVH